MRNSQEMKLLTPRANDFFILKNYDSKQSGNTQTDWRQSMKWPGLITVDHRVLCILGRQQYVADVGRMRGCIWTAQSVSQNSLSADQI
jgi:hypothetical protein